MEAFLAQVGIEMDPSSLKTYVGTDNIDELVELILKKSDLLPLKDAGVSPDLLHALYNAILEERFARGLGNACASDSDFSSSATQTPSASWCNDEDSDSLSTFSTNDQHIEVPSIRARQFSGKWTNCSGDDVEVFCVDGQTLRANLVKKNGQEVHLRFHNISGTWWCGGAFLAEVSASAGTLRWQFRCGRVSKWDREGTIQLPSGALASTQDADSPTPPEAGCQSPSEAYFNGIETFFPTEFPIGKVWELSQDPEGSFLVQEAFDSSDNQFCAAMAHELRGHVAEAAQSPHANHVLQKLINRMPASGSEFVVEELKSCDAPALADVAKNRFGCRVLQRLVEHCTRVVDGMVSELLGSTRALSLHQFGKFVIQHILEYGSSYQRHAIAMILVAHIGKMCSNENGVAVLGSALQQAPLEAQQAITEAILQIDAQSNRLIQLASRRGGKVAVEILLSRPEGGKVRQQLLEHAKSLDSRHGRTVLRLLRESQ